MNKDFWKNKKVLITGAEGFVGSHLLRTLINGGAFVIVLCLNDLDKSPTLSGKDVKKIKRIYSGSVEDINLIRRIVHKEKVKIIFHLAAKPLVEQGQESPLKSFEVNIGGTWNILEVARTEGIEKVIVTSTVHVYGDNPNVPYKENFFPQPSRPYETSKACADLLAQSFADTYDLPVEIPRFVNIYGPGDQNINRVIPKMINMILKGEKIEIWDVGVTRDFLYIDDAINAYIVLAERKFKKNRNLVFNFGSGKPIKITDLVRKIIKVSGKDLKMKRLKVPEIREGEVLSQYVSSEKAKKELGWKPLVNLKEGLTKTYLWYEENYQK